MDGELYQIRYNLPSNTRVPLYNACYSKVMEQSLYTRHKTYSFNLVATNYTRPSFKRDNVVSRERELSFQTANVYNTFVNLLGPQQRFAPDDKTSILERGHLANSQDFLTFDQMDETFKYVNVIPQFRGSNRSNWKRIENWIHSLPRNNTYAEVVTGSFDILRLPHSVNNAMIRMYLLPNNKNPIPLWTYKVVKYDNSCYVFVTLNNDFNTNPNINTPYCRTIACPRGLQFSNAPNSGVSYCCNYNYFVRQIGRHAALC
ncbi:salivary protein Tsal1-like [Cochliomyia hominivorax]